MATLNVITDAELLNEVKRRYDTGMEEVLKLKEELFVKENALSGYKALLISAGLIEAPTAPKRGRKKKSETDATE